MRRFLVALSCALLPGCAKPSQIIVGVITDIPVPTKLQAVQLDALRDGVQLAYSFDSPLATAPGQPFALPGSFDFYSPQGGTPVVQLEVTGFGSDLSNALVARVATVQYLTEDALFFRMALVNACVNVKCSSAETCVEGTCQPQTFDSKRMPRYTKALTDTIECDSGTTFIDTTTCGANGSCMPLPVAGACAAGETCIEGTCYAMP